MEVVEAAGTWEERGRDLARALTTTRVLLPAALLCVIALQITTLNYYYYEDDYVPFGEIVTSGTWEYLRRLMLSQDFTPNWRVIPGLIYLFSYKTSGMNPMTMHAVILAFHLGTAALLYYAVLRMTRLAWAGFVAAVLFGMTPSYIGTLSQVTAITHANGAFFLVATLVAVTHCATAATHRQANAWLAASVVLYVLVIASNEAMAIMWPVFGVAHLSLDQRAEGRLMRSALRTTPLAAVAFSTAIAFTACECNEAARVYGADNAAREFVLYMGRLLWPVGFGVPRFVDTEHRVAAVLVGGLMFYAVAFGGAMGRIGTLWTLLAIIPHVFIKEATATRYTYLPMPGFAMLIVAGLVMLAPAVARVDRRLPLLAGAPLLALVLIWYASQTIEQNGPYDERTAEWHDFYRDTTRVYPQVAPFSKVEILGGRMTNVFLQFFVLPAFAQTTWGPTVTMGSYKSDSEPAGIARISGNPYVAEYVEGELVPLKPVPPLPSRDR